MGTAWYSTGNTAILCLSPFLPPCPCPCFWCILIAVLSSYYVFIISSSSFYTAGVVFGGVVWVVREKNKKNNVAMGLKTPPISEERKGKNGSIYVVLCGSLTPKLYV